MDSALARSEHGPERYVRLLRCQAWEAPAGLLNDEKAALRAYHYEGIHPLLTGPQVCASRRSKTGHSAHRLGV